MCLDGLLESRIEMGEDRVGTAHDCVAVDQRWNRAQARARVEILPQIRIDSSLSRDKRNPELGQSEPHPMRVGAPLGLPQLDKRT
jgi:hypothetical protein